MIVLQKLAKPATGGVPAGAPFLHFWRISYIEPFLVSYHCFQNGVDKTGIRYYNARAREFFGKICRVLQTTTLPKEGALIHPP